MNRPSLPIPAWAVQHTGEGRAGMIKYATSRCRNRMARAMLVHFRMLGLQSRTGQLNEYKASLTELVQCLYTEQKVIGSSPI